MSSTTPTIPDRLLALAADFTRHHDALRDLALLRGPNPGSNLVQRVIPRTQALARSSMDVSDTVETMPRLYRSPEVKAAMERLAQLGALALLAADHILDAADLLLDGTPASGAGQVAGYGTPLLEAGRRIVLARQLTSLGSEDCLATARLLAGELHAQQHLPIEHRPTGLSRTQFRALEAVAAGRVTLDRVQDRAHVRPDEFRLSMSTVRSLESRGLVHRETCPLPLHDERLHLTPDGRTALTALFALPVATPRQARRSGVSTPPSTARPASRPAVSPARSATR
ncbi:hypothetical protein [Streptomyces sp. UH6]|uniref:hypothetical protein n=1 Tax=Streptomyces sp. UH6 TaxID=2748379 RepID=UPI0015D4EDBD|nr:hypothetical protein [Streptomyces sp. UH6]NYV73251.1 hypothetical protein [Streptomyces sp. UH6]